MAPANVRQVHTHYVRSAPTYNPVKAVSNAWQDSPLRGLTQSQSASNIFRSMAVRLRAQLDANTMYQFVEAVTPFVREKTPNGVGAAFASVQFVNKWFGASGTSIPQSAKARSDAQWGGAERP